MKKSESRSWPPDHFYRIMYMSEECARDIEGDIPESQRGKRLLDMSPEELDAVFDEAVESVDDLYPPVQPEGPPPWQGEG
jgi:hypothetical protein